MNSMKIFFSLMLSFSLGGNFSCPTTQAKIKTEYVYLCEGPYSKVYHKSPECRGLARCSTRIFKVTLEEAKKENRRPCKIEYR